MNLQLLFEKSNIHCKLCGSTNQLIFARVSDVPIFLGCTAEPFGNDIFISFNIVICENCDLVTTDAELGKSSYQFLHSEAIGKTWERHHYNFSAFISKYISPNLKILEIGPSSNPISRKLEIKTDSILYCDILKTSPFPLQDREYFVSGTFPDIECNGVYDVVIASHVFEHSNNLRAFLKGVAGILSQNGKFFISIPNFKEWIIQKYWNAITPEHATYLFDTHLLKLANDFGLHVKLEFFENHSLFAVFFRDSVIHQSSSNVFQRTSLNILEEWLDQIKIVIASVEKKLLQKIGPNKCVCIAGASHLSQYPLLMSKFLQKIISVVLDNSEIKSGKRLYGTQLQVHSFNFIRDKDEPVVVIFPSPYQHEMSNQIMSLNKNAVVIKG